MMTRAGVAGQRDALPGDASHRTHSIRDSPSTPKSTVCLLPLKENGVKQGIGKRYTSKGSQSPKSGMNEEEERKKKKKKCEGH